MLVIDNSIGVSVLFSSRGSRVAAAAFTVGLVAVLGSTRPWTSMDEVREVRARFALRDDWDDNPHDD